MFTRPVTHSWLTTDSSFTFEDPLSIGVVPIITTTIVNVTKRHEVNIILKDPLPDLDSPKRYWVLSAQNNDSIRSTDTTTLEEHMLNAGKAIKI